MSSFLQSDADKRFAVQESRAVSNRLGVGGLYDLVEKPFSDIITETTQWYLEKSIKRSPVRFEDGLAGLWRRVNDTWNRMRQCLDAVLCETALDILASHGVPLSKTVSWKGPKSAPLGLMISDCGTLPGQKMGAIEYQDVSTAFASSWGNYLCQRVGLSHTIYERLQNPKHMKSEFLSYAKSWARAYGREVSPSKACVAYCRAHFDGRWKHRKFGESVTTLFLDRFQKELAWASRYRYVCELDHPRQQRYGQYLTDALPDWMKKGVSPSVGNANIAPPSVFPCGDDLHSGLQMMMRVYGLHDYKNCVQNGRFSARKAATLWKTHGVELMATSSQDSRIFWRSMPGVLAHTFLEKAFRDTDYVFMFMLQAFIETQSLRASYPMFERYHSAYKGTVEAIKAHRSGTPDYFQEYRKFGWFHAASFMILPDARKDELLENRDIWLPFIPSKGVRARRLLDFRKKKDFLKYRETEGAFQAMTQEMAARMSILSQDCWSEAMAYASLTGAHLMSPTLRAIRFTYANKNRPLMQRIRYANVLKRTCIAAMCMSTSEWRENLSGWLPAMTMQKLVRATRNEFLSGYGVYGAMNATSGDVDYIAYRALYRKLKQEAGLSFVMDYKSYEKRCVLSPGFEGDKAIREALQVYACRNPWMNHDRPTQGVSELTQKALRMSYGSMMKHCHGVLREGAQFFVKDGIMDRSMFALWKGNIEENGFVDCSNFALSYINFVSMMTLWSRDVFLSLSRPDLLRRGATSKKALPILVDQLCREVVVTSSVGSVISTKEMGASPVIIGKCDKMHNDFIISPGFDVLGNVTVDMMAMSGHLEASFDAPRETMYWP